MRPVPGLFGTDLDSPGDIPESLFPGGGEKIDDGSDEVEEGFFFFE